MGRLVLVLVSKVKGHKPTRKRRGGGGFRGYWLVFSGVSHSSVESFAAVV